MSLACSCRSPGPRGVPRRRAAGPALALLLAVAAAFGTAAAVAAPGSRLVLISLDGLYPDIYRRPRALGVEMPNLERLARDGVSADGMEVVFPSNTYPSHATLITGVRPARHGVVANSVFTPGTRDAPWYWFADSLRVRSLPQAAHAAGRVVAVAGWPSLVGAAWIDWQLPEIWSLGPPDATSLEKCRRWATPGLLEDVERRQGAWTADRFEWGKQDDRITDGAVALVESKRPDFLLVHLVEVDHVLHGEGRDAEPALRAFEAADRQIGRILDALERAGVRDSTNVVVVGDHGFSDVHTDVHPNVELVGLGLATSGGAPGWRALARTSTATAAVYVRRGDAAAGKRAQRHFESMARGRYAGVFRVLSRADLDRYGAYPGAAFGLVCERGYSFSGSDRGTFLSASRSRGMHGYLPEDAAMQAGFVAAGPDFAAGLRVPKLRSLDVAPTLAVVLGADLGPQVEGIVVPGLLRSRER